uniref:Uncharacterized protein n=1 Tax=Vitis vinifera TaxID=29760 RepID=F6GSJ7_VITVI
MELPISFVLVACPSRP